MNLKKQLFLFVLMSLPLIVCAHDIEVANTDGVTIYYNYANNGTALAVTYRGSSYDSYSNEYSGNVVIPEEVTYMNRTRKVTSIGDYAFSSCNKLTSVIIPNSVTSIGGSAFTGCSGLQKVIVKDIAAWCRIFFLDNPLSYAHHLYCDENTEITDLVIPNSVTSIGYRAFSGCSGLTSVTIGNSVTSIGHRAFSGCSRLTSVTIGNSVTSIGDSAFDGVDIPTIISLIENPFTISGKSSSVRVFTLNTFNNATLYVPKGTIDKYKATEGWKDFSFIEEGNPTGIKAVENTKNNNIAIYNLNGVSQPEPQKGMNIVRMGDGTTKKVVMK